MTYETTTLHLQLDSRKAGLAGMAPTGSCQVVSLSPEWVQLYMYK